MKRSAISFKFPLNRHDSESNLRYEGGTQGKDDQGNTKYKVSLIEIMQTGFNHLLGKSYHPTRPAVKNRIIISLVYHKMS